MAHPSPGSLYLLRVQGLNPDTVEDTLRNFLEAKTDRNVENIRYLPGREEAIVSLSHPPDSDGFDKVHRRMVGGRYLIVSEAVGTEEQGDQADGNTLMQVMVSGLAQATQEEDLRNYLEVLTDAEVTNVQFERGRGSALVTFNEEFDLKKVTQKSMRKLNGAILKLSAPASMPDDPAQSQIERQAQISIQSPGERQVLGPGQSPLQTSPHSALQSQGERQIWGPAQSPLQSPEERQVWGPAQSPLQTSPHSALQSPGERQVWSPAQSPLQTSPHSALQSPGERQIWGPAQSPLQSSPHCALQSPGERQVWGPAQIPLQSPEERQVWGPAQIPLQRPEERQNQSTLLAPSQTPALSLHGQYSDTDLEEDFSFISVQTGMKSHSDQIQPQNTVQIPKDLKFKIDTNPSERRFYKEMFNLWDLKVDGMDLKGSQTNTPSYRSHGKRSTGDEFNSISPSNVEVLLKTELPNLLKGVFIHSDDDAMKLYLMGDGHRTVEALERLQIILKSKKLEIHRHGGHKQGFANQGFSNQGFASQEDDAQEGTTFESYLDTVDGNSKTRSKSSEYHMTESTDSKMSQAPMPYSASVELEDSIITALKQNRYMWIYVTDKLTELNIQIVLTNKNAVTISAMSSSALCKAKQLIHRLVIVKNIDFTSESILQFRSMEDIKTKLLNEDIFQRKVLLFNNKNILHVICTNDVLPIVDIEIETMTTSFERRTCQIPGGIDIQPSELERHIQGGRLINHRIKIEIDNQNINLFANASDIGHAKTMLDEYICEKEKESKENAVLMDDIELIPSYREQCFEDVLSYTDFSEDSFSSRAVHIDERSFKRRNEVTDSEERQRLLSESEDMATLTASIVEEDLFGEAKPNTSAASTLSRLDSLSDTEIVSTEKMKSTPKSQTLPAPKAMAKQASRMATPKKSKEMKKKVPVYQSGCASGRKISVKVYKADITKLKVDVIVSAANTLLHHGGGVSRAIAQGAGSALARECQELVKKFGGIKITDLAVTSAGQLPCRKVYHAVGPHWTEYQDKSQCLQELCHTILRCLCCADIQGMRSIAISAISAGIFRVPLESCAKMYVRALKSFDSAMSKGNLKEVHFVDVNEQVVSTIQKTLQDIWNSPLAAEEYKKDHDFIKRCLQDGPSAIMDGSNPSSSSSDIVSCPICLDAVTDPEVLQCWHKFCKPCINRAVQVKKRCPVCDEAIAEEPAGCFKPDSLTSPILDLSSDGSCSICLGVLTSPKKIKCGHTFCTSCIDHSFSSRPICPICYTVCGEVRGVMPTGTMEVHLEHFDSLPGYEQDGTIVIKYSINNGIQTGDHPHPGRGYKGTCQTAYLPDNDTGMQVLNLLRTAWARHLTFTIEDDAVTWNGIQHKTRTTGGPSNNGYPDPSYLARVQQQCAVFGVLTHNM